MAFWDGGISRIENAGFKVRHLPNTESTKQLFGNGYAVRKSTFEEKRDVFARFFRAMAKAIAFDHAAVPPGKATLCCEDRIDGEQLTSLLGFRRVMRELDDLDLYVEEPCRSYEESLSIRRRTGLPFILDECIDGFGPLLRAHGDDAMDVVNLKISRFGGLTKTARARDTCVAMGVAMTIEDASGGDVATAAVAHLAHSTPERWRFTSTDLNGYVTRSYADGAPVREGGVMVAPDAPGLGPEPRLDDLGQPALVIEG